MLNKISDFNITFYCFLVFHKLLYFKIGFHSSICLILILMPMHIRMQCYIEVRIYCMIRKWITYTSNLYRTHTNFICVLIFNINMVSFPIKSLMPVNALLTSEHVDQNQLLNCISFWPSKIDYKVCYPYISGGGELSHIVNNCVSL